MISINEFCRFYYFSQIPCTASNIWFVPASSDIPAHACQLFDDRVLLLHPTVKIVDENDLLTSDEWYQAI